ncbi:hypothetical protein Tco_0302632 [Tanacetum coccineum]
MHNNDCHLEKTEGKSSFIEVNDLSSEKFIISCAPMHITAKVAGKVVSITEASIRTDLIFDDADGIDTLPNQAIFNAIQLMGYEGFLKKKLGKVTPLFDTMLVQPTQDEGASSERLSDEQPSPSPAPTSEIPNESLPDSTSAQSSEVSDQAKENKLLKAKITKLKKQAQPWYQTNAQAVKGRTKEMVDEDKELDEDRLSTEDEVNTDKEKLSTDFEKVSTDKPLVSTDDNEEKKKSLKYSKTKVKVMNTKISTDDAKEATLLINMSKAKATSKEKEKGVELKDVEEIERPRPTSQRSLLTLKPLPKIDPKDKGKKKIEEDDESESEDDDIPQAVKKFKQLESDEELARKVQQEWEAEEEKNRLAEEEATNEALIKNFDDIKARIEAGRTLRDFRAKKRADHN